MLHVPAGSEVQYERARGRLRFRGHLGTSLQAPLTDAVSSATVTENAGTKTQQKQAAQS